MAAGNYTSYEDLKDELEINDTEDDEFLKAIAEKANRYVDDLLYVHAATLPLTGDQKTSAESIALSHAKIKWYVRQRDWEAVKESRIDRDEETEVLKRKLAAQPSTNTQSEKTAYSQSYRSEPLATRTGL